MIGKTIDRFCVSVGGRDFDRCREILHNSLLVELRGDLSNFTIEQVGELVSSHPNLIYTHRLSALSHSEVLEYYIRAIQSGAKYVDVEIGAPIDFIEKVRECAKACSASFIISYHNYETTPNADYLMEIYDSALRKGGEIVKIVTTAHSSIDRGEILSLYQRIDRDSVDGLVAFAMGEEGRTTRLDSLKLGAPYTYVAYSEECITAPGQFTLKEIEQLYLEYESYRKKI